MMFSCGDVVLVPFPFTDLSSAKRRPALLLRSLGEFGDWLCLPVSTQGAHPASLPLRDGDFSNGFLPKPSWIRYNRPTILSEQIMLGRVATLNVSAVESVRLLMCRALACDGLAVMESRANYRSCGDTSPM